MGFGSAGGFALMQRAAMCLCKSSLVPKAYQGEHNVSNCVIALNMANRLGADPLMVMQNLYVVHGTPSWSAQFLIACLDAGGRFDGIDYEFSGEEGSDDWGCRAFSVNKETGKLIYGTKVTIGLAKKAGWYDRKDKNGKYCSPWRTNPEQMLRYRAGTLFVRAYSPGVAMGLQTREELEDTGPESTGIIDARNTDVDEIERLRKAKRGVPDREEPAVETEETPGPEDEVQDDPPESVPDRDSKAETSKAPEMNAASNAFLAEIDRASGPGLLQEFSDTIAESSDINESQRQFLFGEIKWRIEAMQDE